MKTEKHIETEFIKKFNELGLTYITSKRFYNIEAIISDSIKVPFDVAIKIGRKILAIIVFNIKQEIKGKDLWDLNDYSKDNNVRFWVLSDGEIFIVHDNKRKIQRDAPYNFDDFVEIIQKKEAIDVKETKDLISGTIKTVIAESQFMFLKEGISCYDNLQSEIYYDELEQVFSFRNPSDVGNVENRIFRLLLKDEKPIKTIFRYTSIDSIYSILTSNSMRMNCIVGMNDTTEVNYAENYIFGTNLNYSEVPWQTIDAYNSRFICSCSLKEDDLTQWRLYAEDSKGVCLVFNVNSEKLDSEFIVKRISYGTSDGRHPELDLIKNIMLNLKKSENLDFKFKTLNTWKHFFKPYDYKVEDEVRILYITSKKKANNKGWVLTNSHKILNPYIEIPLNYELAPFQLTNIILGPKCPEKEINLRQFEQLIRELKREPTNPNKVKSQAEDKKYNVSTLKVSLSKIRNYR